MYCAAIDKNGTSMLKHLFTSLDLGIDLQWGTKDATVKGVRVHRKQWNGKTHSM